MKHCSKCDTDKELDQFCTDNRTPDKKKRWCTPCCTTQRNTWKANNVEHDRAVQDKYKLENAESIKQTQNKWRAEHKEYIKQRDAEKYLLKKEQILARCKKWAQDNRERRNESNRQYLKAHPGKAMEYRRKYLSDFKNHLHVSISRSILKSLRGGDKGGVTWHELVGYDTESLINHLTKTMPQGYIWDDYGREKLHIDHIIPLAAFNFASPQDIDFKRCWSLKNLRLLPAFENMSKSDTLDRPFQPSLAIAG